MILTNTELKEYEKKQRINVNDIEHLFFRSSYNETWYFTTPVKSSSNKTNI